MSEHTILEIENCKGKLSWRDSSLDFKFKLSCGRDGSIAVSPDPLPLSLQSKFLLELGSTRSRRVEEFTLLGSGPDGEWIETKSARLTRWGTSSDKEGAFINLEISTDRLDLSWQRPKTSDPSEPISLEYFVPGLRCFGSVEIEASFGKVHITGATDVKDYNELTGVIRVTTTLSTDSPEATQLENLDSGVRRLLEVLSLADGRFMRWSIRRVVSCGQLCSAIFRGPMRSSESRFPFFSFLNLQPIVQIAVEQYTEELCRATGIDLAIEWFLMHPQYSEAQFLTGMTALEHLIHVFGKQHPRGGILPSNLFKKEVRPRLQNALDSAFRALPAEILAERSDAQEVMSRKLGNLNQRTLRGNLEALLKCHSVPVSDIETEIPSLIRRWREIKNLCIVRVQAVGRLVPAAFGFSTLC